ncbi:hypothetical protein N474_07490 [Pseudoalteromonas luteoviolacea CPMOR-2]|uniref:Uncharacterized protein n=1 Tax=Pseudoalteromonas luteoviolacea DSM 6061 TaxID=1365250 RepID=A0A161XXU7_9GAMM|nr:hypothetical protein N475_14100 [Pseudoalteromonas luteoviolacea DSM 6061]KZN57815.1 hypothetical protein N474_07490 [Pseudoalteromonas luteoviolacea CPMOR-2]
MKTKIIERYLSNLFPSVNIKSLYFYNFIERLDYHLYLNFVQSTWLLKFHLIKTFTESHKFSSKNKTAAIDIALKTLSR